jgi:O-antigen/teichoic acid export membrane protein
VFFGKAAATLRDQPSQLPRLFFTTAGVLFAAGIIPALLLMLFAGPLVRFVFGGAWADAGAYVQLMALALLAGITVSTVSPIISVTQKQDWQLAVDIIRTVLVLAVFYIAHLVHASALTAVGAYVGVLLITYGLFFGVFSLAAFAGARQTRLEGPGGTAPGAE